MPANNRIVLIIKIKDWSKLTAYKQNELFFLLKDV